MITNGLLTDTLITRGLGKTLYIVVSQGGGTVLPVPHIKYEPFPTKKEIEEGIQTRKILISGEKQPIEVDVLLIKHTGSISVEAILKEVSGKYAEIKVLIEDEVKFYD